MNLASSRCFIYTLFVLVFVVLSGSASAIERPGEELQDVGLSTGLGTEIDMSLRFIDASGSEVRLADFKENRKPLVIIPAYYRCPKLCGLLLSGVTELFNEMDFALGKEFNAVTVSFNPREGHELAAERQATYREKLTKNGVNPEGWDFLVDQNSSVKALMKGLGFHYKEDKKDFAHTAALFILTPDGRISQYFTGIKFSAWDVRLALVEASMGGVGSLLDHVLLYCFRFDPLKGRYTLVAQNIMRAGGALTLILLTGLIVTLRRREKSEERTNSSKGL